MQIIIFCYFGRNFAFTSTLTMNEHYLKPYLKSLGQLFIWVFFLTFESCQKHRIHLNQTANTLGARY